MRAISRIDLAVKNGYITPMRFYDVQNAGPMTCAAVLRQKAAIGTLCRRYGVELCFLHGSLATHRHGPLSDVDIAIYAPRLPYRRLLRLQGNLATLLHRDDIDMALLHRGSSLLGMHVLTKGVALYVQHPHRLRRFRYETFRRYLDSQFLRRRFAQYVMEAML